MCGHRFEFVFKKSSMSLSQDYFGFYYNIAQSEKRYIVACVKLYDKTGTYISLKFFKKKTETTTFVSTNNPISLSTNWSEREKILMLSEEKNLSRFANEQSSSGKMKFQMRNQ